MEPTRLRLTNFLSYRDATLDLGQVDIAALVGDNGSGKSSLLDALTWALFGESTKGGARALDHHVTRGETEGSVSLEFVLHGQTYRVIRGRSVARNRSNLEFAVRDGDEWRALGGKSLSEAQAAIEQTLRMDYRTFTASSLILQGKSDSFTADMTDAERKDALARILGLDLWDKVQESARGRVRDAKAVLAGIEARARQYKETTAARAAIEEQIQLDRAALADAVAAAAAAGARVGELEAQLAQRSLLERQLAENRDAERKALARAQQADSDIAACDAEARRHQAEAERETSTVDTEIRRLQGILARRDEIEQAVACEADLAAEVASHEKRAQERMQLADEASALERKVASHDKAVESEIARLTADFRSAEAQARLLDEVPCSGTVMDSCKLLGSARAAVAAAGSIAERLTKLHTTPNPHVDAWQAAVHTRDAVGYDPGGHQTARAALEELRQTARLKPALDAAEQRAAEMALRREHIADDCRRRQSELAKRRRQSEEAKAEAELHARGARECASEIGRALAALDPAQRELAEVRSKLDDARVREAGLRNALGRLEAELAACDKAAAALEALEAEAAAARDEEGVYSLLDQAASKRGGVPALIIESAVPEIERLANDMLSRMAGGRLQVRLDTQAEGKSTGTMQEVLRITVCDQGADRPYLTYSGAERFLVDLSLRVAISKFLAHRSGAEIRLFVLDEGIGCCDASNRQAVMDAIQTVAQEFSKVLVVTHLAELQDAFSHRIEVSKGSDGSTVRVVA